MRLASLSLALLLSATALAEDVKIAHSGYLLAANDTALSGDVSMTFGLFSSPIATTPTWTATTTVTVAEGYYSVLLGDPAAGFPALPITEVSSDRWLGVQVGSTPLLPRLALARAPVAIRAGDADALGGVPAAQYVQGSALSAYPLLDGTRAFTGAVTLSGAPTLANHAATKSYVDTTAANAVTLGTTGLALLDGTRAFTGALTLSGAPTLANHAATKDYVDTAAANAVTLGTTGLALLDGTRAFTGPVTLSGAPTLANHAATKGYVDGAVSGALVASSISLTGDTSTDTLTLRPRASAPTNPVAGMMYVDTTGKVFVYSAGAWAQVGAGAGGVTRNSDGVANVTANKDLSTQVVGAARTATTGDAAVMAIASLPATFGTTLTLSTSPVPLAIGDEIVIFQGQGSGTPGTWELHLVTGISGTAVQLDSYLQKSFTGKVWAQRVPNYTSLTVAAGVQLTTKAWDGNTGGLLFVRVSGTATINGAITMAAKGFAGGAPLNVNSSSYVPGFTGESACGASTQNTTGSCGSGGGGYVHNTGNHRSGGGGGGYGTAGTNGQGQIGMNVGAFGAGGSTYGQAQLATQLLFGAGGGGGAYNYSQWLNPVRGGYGGGAIVLLADTLTFGASGEISADGEAPPALSGSTPAEAVGGGGAGGSVYVTGTTLSLGTTRLHAVGANGFAGTCCGATGGNGGVGRIAIKGTTVSGTTNPTYVVGL